jgi:hypothetical protein
MEFEIHSTVKSLEALSDVMTSYSMASSSVWPNVTLPSKEFELHMYHSIEASFVDLIWMAPIVENALLWEEYSQSITNGSNVPSSPSIFAYGSVPNDVNKGPMKRGKLPIDGRGPFTPIHQMFPSPPPFISNVNGTIVNYDTSSDQSINATHSSVTSLFQPVLSGLLPLFLIRDAYPEFLEAEEPLSLFVAPIYKDFDHVTVMSYVEGLFQWKFIFSKISVGRANLLCFVESTCGDSFSFIVDGENTSYIGIGDAHEKKFDAIHSSTVIGLPDISETGIEKATKAGVCVFTLTLYPTIEFRQTFNSNAVVYSAIVGLAMVFMSGSFFFYD